MVTIEDIRQLTKDEKLRVMEAIWADLTSNGEDIESPAWHEKKLQETTERVATGQETPIDWANAKADLRAERK